MSFSITVLLFYATPTRPRGYWPIPIKPFLRKFYFPFQKKGSKKQSSGTELNVLAAKHTD